MIALSAVVPVYNRAEMLLEALESIRGQTLPPDEIIVVDDGSTDGSALKAATCPGVRVAGQRHLGVAAARNRGIALSRGRLIAFLDADDLWDPKKLKIQKGFMDRHPSIPLSHTAEIWVRNGRRVNPGKKYRKRGGDVFRACLETCFIAASTVMARRELFETVGNFDESFPACEDYDLWLRIACRFPVGYIDTPLATRREGHEDQLSHTVPHLEGFRVEALFKLLEKQNLPAAQKEKVLDCLARKARIVISGLEKKNLTREAEALAERVEDSFVLSLDRPSRGKRKNGVNRAFS